jgi:hypothetical protein
MLKVMRAAFDRKRADLDVGRLLRQLFVENLSHPRL